MTVAIVDTGPLVALFDRSERHHRWVAKCFEELEAPLLVCEPVLAEAWNWSPMERCKWRSGLTSMSARCADCFHKYRDTPMSLANACIVRMSGIHDRP